MRVSHPTLKTAVSATLHCLTGCAIGEILGMVIGTALGWHGAATVALSISLAFLFGYTLSMLPLLRAGLTFKTALPIVLAADTLSIVTMEIADNIIMIAIPGAMNAGLANPIFWASLVLSLIVAFTVTVPVNYLLIKRGKGHALTHQYHHGKHQNNHPGAHHHGHH